MPKLLILYAYFETPDAQRNLGFFCRHGISLDRDRHHMIVVNGTCSIEDQIPKFDNVTVLRRPNKGFDFGAWAHALSTVQLDQFTYFFFLNGSVTGPFLPSYQDASRWPEVFTALLNDRVKLVGITINGFLGAHVQSMFLATDRIGLDLLVHNGIFTGNDKDLRKYEDVVFKREVRSSKIIMDNGFAIDSLAVPRSGRLKQHLTTEANTDIIHPGAYLHGYTLEPLDVVFFKTNRGCSPAALERSMRLADHKRDTAATRCFQDTRILRTLEALKRVPSSWTGYLELGIWLTCRFLPHVVVDLGVDCGASTYAWGTSGTSQVIGVDWFKGDQHTGFRDTEAVVQALGRELARDHQYPDTVRIWRSSFEDAAKAFDRKVDVLHVDGLHTTEAVKRDIDTWLPKLSNGGLLVMHNTRVYPNSVGTLFDALPLPKTRLEHSAGLGIASRDAAKIDAINKEWKDRLYRDAGGLRHHDFDGLRIQDVPFAVQP